MDPYTNEFGPRVIFPFTQRGFKICTSHDPHLKMFRAAQRDGASFSLVGSSTRLEGIDTPCKNFAVHECRSLSQVWLVLHVSRLTSDR